MAGISLALGTARSLASEGGGSDKEIIQLDNMDVVAKVSRIAHYKELAEVAFENALKERKISYADVLMTSYPEVDIVSILKQKKAYRETVEADWFCNYGAIQTEVTLRVPLGRIREGGGVDWKRRVIFINESQARNLAMVGDAMTFKVGNAPSEILFHLSGMMLSNFLSKRNIERVKELGKARGGSSLFADQVYFETQLQELNRSYFILTKKVIMTPVDSLVALRLLGAEFTKETVEAIFKKYRIAYTPADVALIMATKAAEVSQTYSTEMVAFRFAQYLVRGNVNLVSKSEVIDPDAKPPITMEYQEEEIDGKGLAQMSRKEAVEYLGRIALQAPGHM